MQIRNNKGRKHGKRNKKRKESKDLEHKNYVDSDKKSPSKNQTNKDIKLREKENI
jgi:hypothetical protein